MRRQGELREQQRRDQEQEEARQEEFKKEQRSQNIKEKLRFVDFARNTSSEFSTCTACTSDASSVSWSRRNSRSESASSESGNSCNRFESGNSCNGEENHVHAVDLEAQINKPFNCACSDRDLEAQTDSDEDYCCPICFAEFEEGNLISVSNNTDCKHSFHKECITEWLLTQDGCPVCRRAYLGEEETCDKDAVESSNSSDTEDEDSSISQTSSDDDSSSSTTHATSEENIDC